MTTNQDLEKTRKALDDLEATLKKELGPVVYALSRAVRWVNRMISKGRKG